MHSVTRERKRNFLKVMGGRGRNTAKGTVKKTDN